MNHDETINRIQKLVPSVMDSGLKCSDCDGVGFTAGHDTPGSHSEDGECLSCPVKVGCETCTGAGIIGKPITLAVIFQAIHATMLLLQEDDYKKQESSHDLIDYFSTPEGGVFGPCWNLEKDNFNDQSDETKTFIGGLLGDTE